MSMQTARNGAPVVAAGQTASEGADGASISRTAETAAAAAAAQQTALVQAAYVVARQNPRDLLAVREAILARCRMARFAEVALYKKPVGGSTVSGLSIRFAEAMFQALGNARARDVVTYDDDTRRIVNVAVIDLQSNAGLDADVAFDKTIERSKLPQGMLALRTRTNSYGKLVYLIPATDDELQIRQAALVSKKLRTLILRISPGEILDEAREVIERTIRGEVVANPGDTIRRMTDAFGRMGIRVAQLQEYLGHSLDVSTPDEILELRGVAQLLSDKQTTWRDVMTERRTVTADGEVLEGSSPDVTSGAEATPTPPPVAPKRGGDALADRLRAQAVAPANAPARAQQAPEPPPSAPSEREPGED